MLPEGTPGKYTVTISSIDGTRVRLEGRPTIEEARAFAAEQEAIGFLAEIVESKPRAHSR